MIIILPKTWFQHSHYNKTTLNFPKGCYNSDIQRAHMPQAIVFSYFPTLFPHYTSSLTHHQTFFHCYINARRLQTLKHSSSLNKRSEIKGKTYKNAVVVVLPLRLVLRGGAALHQFNVVSTWIVESRAGWESARMLRETPVKDQQLSRM